MSEEKVLVFHLQKFENDLDRRAFISSLLKSLQEDTKFAKTLFSQFEFKERSLVENDDNYIQLNYQTLLYKVTSEGIKVFTNCKLSGSTEKRLLGRLNVFAGGHCNETDIHAPQETILDFMIHNRDRELAEEVNIQGNLTADTLRYTSHLYIDTEEVSRHHACLYDVHELPTDCIVEITDNERHKLSGEFYDIHELLKSPQLDGWSRYALLELIERGDRQC